MVNMYVDKWIERITDITEDVKKLKTIKDNNKLNIGLLPNEKEYYVDDNVKDILGMRQKGEEDGFKYRQNKRFTN